MHLNRRGNDSCAFDILKVVGHLKTKTCKSCEIWEKGMTGVRKFFVA